jgi:hypothetical protein
VAAAVAGSASAQPPGFNAAKTFDVYRLYWPGAEVDELPMEGVQGVYPEYRGGPPTRWYFSYGSCELHGTDHPSCSLPLSVENDSTCDRWTGELLPKRARPFGFRGAKAYWHRGLPAKGGGEEIGGVPLEIFTGRTTVTIFADEKKVAFAAAAQLRTLTQKHPHPLPPPVAGSLWGKLPCQVSPSR